jgi:hypothetical protein
MTIRSQYYDLTKDMPSSFNFLVLHYSSDRFVVYCCFPIELNDLTFEIFSEVLYAALFNSKMLSGKGTTSTGATKTNTKTTGLII